MRLQHYVNEQLDSDNIKRFDDIITVIKKDCQPFLKEFKNISWNPIYRGTLKEQTQEVDLVKVRSRRKRIPKDTPKHLHDLMNELFFKHHGWKARSEGVFVTHDREDAGHYGWQLLFFPKGKYQYIYSPYVFDMYTTLRRIILDTTVGDSPRTLDKEQITPEFKEDLEHTIKRYEKVGYDNVNDRNEAMFKVHEYYVVSLDNKGQERGFLKRLKESL